MMLINKYNISTDLMQELPIEKYKHMLYRWHETNDGITNRWIYPYVFDKDKVNQFNHNTNVMILCINYYPSQKRILISFDSIAADIMFTAEKYVNNLAQTHIEDLKVVFKDIESKDIEDLIIVSKFGYTLS